MTTKISELTDAGDIASGDTVPVVRAGSTQRANVPIDTTGSLLTTGNLAQAETVTAKWNFTADAQIDGSDIGPIESGTWTPVLVGDTKEGNNSYQVQQGEYHLRGKICTATFQLRLDGSSGALDSEGSLNIHGLPFAPKTATRSAVVEMIDGGALSNGSTIKAHGRGGPSRLGLRGIDGSGNSGDLNDSEVTNNFRVIGTYVYEIG